MTNEEMLAEIARLKAENDKLLEKNQDLQYEFEIKLHQALAEKLKEGNN